MPIDWNNLKDKLNYYLILLIAFFIPLKKEVVAPLIILFFISSVLNRKKNFTKNINKKLFLIVGFYVLGVMSLFYGENTSNTWFNNEIKLSLFAFPLCFFISNLDFKKIFRPILKSFVEGTLFAVLLSFVNASVVFYYQRDSTVFFYSDLAYFSHASYFSLYLNFSIAILYYFWFSPSKIDYISPSINFGLSFLLSLVILMLASKSGIATMLLVHFIGVGYWVKKYKKYKQACILLGTLTLFIALGLYNSPAILERITTMKNSIVHYNGTPNSSTNIRLAVWEEAIELIKAKTVVGYGTGDVADVLSQRYHKKGFYELEKKQLNSHNQFIQITLGSGIIGLLFFIFLVSYPFIFLTKSIDRLLYFSFFVLIFFNFLTESMLETQSGIIFFAFYITLFYSIETTQNKFNKI